MSYTHYAAVAVAVAACTTATTAEAAKKCDIVGKFTDTLGSTGKFTSETKGTVSNSNICADPYKLTVTKLNLKDINIKGISKDKTCGDLTGKFVFQDNGCTTASGTVTIAGLGSLADTITHTGKLDHHAPADTSMLSNGLK